MLLQNHCRADRGFQTVGLIALNHFAKGPQRAAFDVPSCTAWAEKPLHLRRCSKRLNQSPFFAGKGFSGGKCSSHKALAEALPLSKANCRGRSCTCPSNAVARTTAHCGRGQAPPLQIQNFAFEVSSLRMMANQFPPQS